MVFTVSPASVINFIEETFPTLSGQTTEETATFRLRRDWLPYLAAVLELVSHIAPEQLPTDTRSQVELLASVAAIRAVVSTWTFGDDDFCFDYAKFADRHPLDLLRRALGRQQARSEPPSFYRIGGAESAVDSKTIEPAAVLLVQKAIDSFPQLEVNPSRARKRAKTLEIKLVRHKHPRKRTGA